MSVLVILRGNSGSGKTTVAKALQKELGSNILLISQDMIRREMLNAKDGLNTRALPLLIQLLNYGYKYCDYVILEGILNADWYKDLFDAAIDLYDDSIYAYYYDIPFTETIRRHSFRAKQCDFSEEDMLRWWNEKDFIGSINEKVFDESISAQDAVDIICNDIRGIAEYE